MSVRPLAILDIETDPFLYGRVPQPFAVEVYTVEQSKQFWGSNCIEDSIAYLASWSQPHVICAHNGGKFDFMYYLQYITGNLKIINGRIVSAKCAGHEFRDSYAILPFPLRDYNKDEIDYDKFEAGVRDRHKIEILEYLHSDCKYLHMLVSRFYTEFGQKYLTVGSAAMSQIKQRHAVTRTGLAFDRTFRKDFFFGGRVECFETGVQHGDFSIYDVNSMYPDRMRNSVHPADDCYSVGDAITNDTCFVVCTGENKGAFPQRGDKGLSFESGVGTYSVSRQEFECALDTHTFVPHSIERTFDFPCRHNFAGFVDYGFDARQNAKECGDTAGDIAWKYVVNSGYGKFAQNPANFSDWKIATVRDWPRDVCPHCKGSGECYFPTEHVACYQCQALNDFETIEDACCMFCMGDGMRWHLYEYDHNNPDGPMLWSARTFQQSYYNVATGASITGASRAKLLHGLSLADSPVYCDTDSIITRGAFRGDVGKQLGQWKHEGTGQLAAIAGKKLYCIFADREPELNPVERRKYPWMLDPVWYNGVRYWPIKKAHKGMKLTPEEILSVAQGSEIDVPNHAPSFSCFRKPVFIKRTARRTV